MRQDFKDLDTLIMFRNDQGFAKNAFLKISEYMGIFIEDCHISWRPRGIASITR
jgi:hypothetical protein